MPGYNERMKHLGDLSNTELVASLRARVKSVHLNEASIVAHLVEIEERRLYSDQACSSMWMFCLEREGFSENQTQLRLAAARIVTGQWVAVVALLFTLASAPIVLRRA